MSKKQAVTLEWFDGATIIGNKKNIVAYLRKAQVNWQAWLWLWKYKGLEKDVYNYIDCIDILVEWIEAMEKSYSDYNKKQEEERQQKEKEAEKAKKVARDALWQ